MGKQSANNSDQLRQYRAEMRQQQQASKRRQTKIILLVSALALLLCAAIVLLIVFLDKPEGSTDSDGKPSNWVEGDPNNGSIGMDELDFSTINPDAFSETDAVTNYVKMNVTYTDKDGNEQTGDIVIRLFDKVAPATVANFQNLVKRGFYNGSSFHRVLEGFMIQGGSGKGESSLTPIMGEFTNNGYQNNLEHLRGVVSMARTNDPNSATSQFFIMHEDTIEVDHKYASFGYVAYGMETVDGIAPTKVVYNPAMEETSSPEQPITINSAVFITPESN